MTNLKFARGEEIHLFPLRNQKTDIHALKLNDKYIDLTTNVNLTSFNRLKFNIENTIYYLRDRYFNSHSGSTGNFYNKAYKPSSPITHTINVPIGNYKKYKIAINGNFDVNGWFDFNNSSYFDCSHFKGNFADTVNPIDGGGHRWSGYDVTQVDNSPELNMDYPVETMNGELTLTGNVSDLTSSDKQIFYRQMTNSRGDGVYVNFRVYAKIINSELIVTYGWWLNGYDERCNGNVSYSINIGVCTHE